MNKFFKNLKLLPRWIIVVIDLGFLLFAVVLGYLLRFNFELDSIERHGYEEGLILFLLCGLFSTLITGNYSGIIRYTGIQDAFRVFGTISLSTLLCLVINYSWVLFGSNGPNLIPLSVLLIAYMAGTIFLISYRIIVKLVFSYYSKATSGISNALIFGAGEAGQITRQIFESEPGRKTRIVGYLEDDKNKIGKVLNGLKIYSGKNFDFKESLLRRIDEVIISIPNLSTIRKNEIVDFCLKENIKVKHVPPVQQWTDGEFRPNQVKEIKIDDLLGRDSIRLDNFYVNQELEKKTVLITGAAGSIGSEMVRQVITFKPTLVIILDQSESGLFELENEIQENLNVPVILKVADITDHERMEAIFHDFAPSIVFHAAAYKHVPLMEDNPSEAVRCNIGGTKVVADLSVKYGASKFVMISTDKAVNPTSVMGASKRIAEKYVQALNNEKTSTDNHTRFITTRFGNVLGSNGSVIPLFEKQINRGGPITVTHPDITRYFMTIPEACQLVLEAGAMGRGGEVFIFDMGESIKIVDLAKKMINLSGLKEGLDIEIMYTGLREGEKLHEELLTNKETNTPTHNDKILIAQVEEVTFFRISREVDLLLDTVTSDNDYNCVLKMKQIVPEFKSNSSRFEQLDQLAK